MIYGLEVSTFTTLHVLLSLVGMGSGLVVLLGLMNGQRSGKWTLVFLATTIATNVTGLLFPSDHQTPGQVVGMISLVVLGLALVARYSFHLAGVWRRIYVISVCTALYFNVFVGVVQAFQKVPALRALAPTQAEPPFAIAQLAVLAGFVVSGVFAVKKFKEPEGRSL